MYNGVYSSILPAHKPGHWRPYLFGEHFHYCWDISDHQPLTHFDNMQDTSNTLTRGAIAGPEKEALSSASSAATSFSNSAPRSNATCSAHKGFTPNSLGSAGIGAVLNPIPTRRRKGVTPLVPSRQH